MTGSCHFVNDVVFLSEHCRVLLMKPYLDITPDVPKILTLTPKFEAVTTLMLETLAFPFFPDAYNSFNTLLI